MKSNLLNQKIREICDEEEFEIKGGKCIPYLGWFWRDVDFDADYCVIGIIPGEFKGFMENNKWGYEEFYLEGKEWNELKKLLEIAVKNPSRTLFNNVWDFIQKLEGENE